MTASPHPSVLSRSLGVWDAIAIGVASMVGAGVFAVWAPAAQAAGDLLLAGLVIAAAVAWCNATSSAQLAAQYPTAGGAYVYGRRRLGEWPGFLAGWSFVVGKSASIAAMSLTLAAYLAPADLGKPVAIAAVWLLVGVNLRGVTRTALAAKVLAVTSLAAIIAALLFGWINLPLRGEASFGWPPPTGGWYGVLQSAGLMFFVFAGYARIATLGEEVRDPSRSIGRAIVTALIVVLALYFVVSGSLLRHFAPHEIAAATAPLTLLAGDNAGVRGVLVAGAAAAVAGALLALLSGVGRTGLAMAREGDLPRWFDRTHPVTRVPHRVELVLAAVLTAVILVADLRGAIGFSSFGVLLYYLIANLAAFTQGSAERRYPRALQLIGAALCLVLMATLPWQSVVGGVGVLAVGVLARLLGRRGLR